MVDLPIPPQMGLDAIPEVEHPAAQKVRHHLAELWLFVGRFKVDLQLFTHCKANFHRLLEHQKQLKPAAFPPELYEEQNFWLHAADIPLRDSAMNIRNFGIAAQSVKDALANSPSVSKRVNHEALCQALKDFDAAFPDSREMRNAVAHPADKGNEAPKHELTGQHQSAALDKAGDSPITLTGVVTGSLVTETWKGKVRQSDLSEEKLKILRDVQKAIYEAFPKPQWDRR
jgi:hypothetical protein